MINGDILSSFGSKLRHEVAAGIIARREEQMRIGVANITGALAVQFQDALFTAPQQPQPVVHAVTQNATPEQQEAAGTPSEDTEDALSIEALNAKITALYEEQQP